MRRFRQLEWWRVPAAILALLGIALVGVALGQDPPKFQRGARPSTPAEIANAISSGRATLFKVGLKATPPSTIVVPPRLSMWGNNQYGDCVSAEAAFAIAAYSTFILGGDKEIFVTEATVISWARAHGVLNGASLIEVNQAMQRDGMKDENNVLRREGPAAVVDYSSEATLMNAISQGPVDIAIAADSLPSGAGNRSGWYAFGGSRNRNTDHCVSLCGYGPMKDLFAALNTPMPANVPNTTGYLLFTWNTIGVVDHKWLMNTCEEAWLRNPTIVGIEPPPPPPVQTVIVSPGQATVAPGERRQFGAVTDGTVQPVTWTASGGTIDQTGLYTAGTATGTFLVVATSKADTTKFGTAVVTISSVPPPPPPIGGLTITLGQDTPRGTYDLVTSGKYAELQRNIEEIEAIIKRMKAERQKPVPPPPPEKKPSLEETQTQEPPVSVPVPSVEELAAKRAKLKWNPDRQPKRDPKTGRILQK